MSAWIVTAAHIDAMINSALEHGVVPGNSSLDALSALGQDLWQENHDSVNFRYDEDEACPAYRFTGTEIALDPVQVQALVVCFEYQSSEHPDWESSNAIAWCACLRAALVADLRVGHARRWEERKDVAWGIESMAEIALVAKAA